MAGRDEINFLITMQNKNKNPYTLTPEWMGRGLTATLLGHLPDKCGQAAVLYDKSLAQTCWEKGSSDSVLESQRPGILDQTRAPQGLA